MKGLELVIRAMNRLEVNRIPWVPFVGVHAGELIGKNAVEYLSSSDNIVSGVSKAIELYNPDGIPVMFDLQIEAEALGCKLNWSEENPPSVISHPLSGEKLQELKMLTGLEARIPDVMNAASRLKELHPDLALYGLVTGPFTLALHLLGTDIFLKIFEDPEYLHQLMSFTSEVSKFMSHKYIEAGCDVIAVVDPMTSQIDPVSFGTFVSPYLKDVFALIRAEKALSSFFVCGDARQNIEVMCNCNPDNISIDENIPLDYVRDTALQNRVSFGGNIKLTVSLLMGTEEDAMRDALECMDIAGKKGYILAPGCDLPMNTPRENLVAVARLVHNEQLQGKLRASSAPVSEIRKLDLKNHWQAGKVVIDIITLDSSSCAPCQYMVDAVEKARINFGEKVICKEYRIKDKEGVQMMVSLGVQSVPTIVIDGNVEFSSQIPPINKLKERIEYYLKSKK